MNTIAIFLKQLRKTCALTQPELAELMGVSTVLISMIESGQKTASIKFVNQLAETLGVHPGAIAPLAFAGQDSANGRRSPIEQKLIDLGQKLQQQLIEKKAKELRNNV